MHTKRMVLTFVLIVFFGSLFLGVAGVSARTGSGFAITSLTSLSHPEENTWSPSNDPGFSWSSMTLLGNYPAAYANGVAVSGSLAYVADQYDGLLIADVSNPAAPVTLGQYRTPSFATGVAVSGNYAYVADGYSGLQVIDVSNPAAPTRTGSYLTPSYAHGVVVSGNLAYAADDFAGLMIIDVSNPAAPALAGSYNTIGSAMGVAVSGNYAYVSDYDRGLQIIDVSNPAAPTLAGAYDTPDYAAGVAVSGGYAYVADGVSGLQIINVSNPAAPALTGSYDTRGNAYGVTLSGSYAYVADGDAGLQIINISNPAAPRLADSYDTPGRALGVAISGADAYVADYFRGVQILNADLPVGYSYAIDQIPGTIPDNIPEGAEISASYLNLADGDWYFHLRSVDATGVWGPVAQRRVRIDTGGPVISNVAPTGTINSNDAVLSADLSDSGSGVNAASSTISIDGGPAIEICTRTATSISCPVSGLTPGNYTIVVTVSDNAGNRGSASGSFAISTLCGAVRPALGLRLGSVYWQSYADYTQRLLSVGYTIDNPGPDKAYGVVINGTSDSHGVNLASGMPLTLGDIAGGQSVTFSLKYNTPPSVVSFRTTVGAAAQDGCANSYLYPLP